MATTHNILKNWKSQLHELRIDLVGDYAGRELFIVEGDSLLRHALSDERIDMEDGFQLLHLVYVVESFLLNLKKRGCNFHLVFFEENKYNCVIGKQSMLKGNVYKYLFARSAIIQHLINTSRREIETKSEEGETVFRIFQFQNPYHDGFEQYLKATRPYFVMCHDIKAGDGTGKNATFLLIGFVWRMIMGDYNVAWINTAEFRDSKVIISIVQGGPRTLIKQLPDESHIAYKSLVREHSGGSCDYNFSEICTDQIFTERELMAVASISTLLKGINTNSSKMDWGLASFLLHVAFLNHLSLPQRHIAPAQTNGVRPTIGSITKHLIIISCNLLGDKDYMHAASQLKSRNIHDFVDGRLLVRLEHGLKCGDIQLKSIPGAVVSDFTRMAKAVEIACGHTILLSMLFKCKEQSPLLPSSGEPKKLMNEPINPKKLEVLPFSNPTFDPFLSRIKLNIDSSAASKEVDELRKELSDRDNRKRKMTKSNRILPVWKPSANKWLAGRARKPEQRHASNMAKYAASLVGAKGKILEPIVITNGPRSLQPNIQPTPAKIIQKAGKKERPLSKKEMIRAENNKKLIDKGDLTLLRMWKTLYGDIQEIKDDLAKISQLEQFLKKINSTLSKKGEVVDCEVRIYKVWILLRFWSTYCREGKREDGYGVIAKVFSEVKSLLGSKGLTKEIHKILMNLFESLGISLPPRLTSDPLMESRLTFKLPWDGNSLVDVSLQMTSTEFQLLHCGQYMDRDMDSKADPRVSFEPDGWQRKVLDEIDRNNSVFVVAPTSAGKTFISFYAMEKILRSGDDDVLVYIAPNKALVNQVAAEVLARFQKRYPHAGKSVWAIHTRDRRVGNSTGCQILVTVPHILQIMLLAPINANSWSQRVKRIIFDEIHCIGHMEDGAIWEQLIMLSPCPIIALSATVGNPEEFAKWMESTQKPLGIKLKMIQHHHRYSDLRKMVYVMPKNYEFSGLVTERKFPRLESSSSLVPIHPVSSLVDISRGMPDDLALEPRDCLWLYQAMKERSTEKYPLDRRLDPEQYFSKFPIIHKVNVINWEVDLKTVLRRWMNSSDSPFQSVVQKLMGPLSKEPSVVLRRKKEQINSYPTEGGKQSFEEAIQAASNLQVLCRYTLPLLDELNKKDALPAIIFSLERSICEDLCYYLTGQLAVAESRWRESDPVWKETMRKWEEYKEVRNNAFVRKRAQNDARAYVSSKAERLQDETTKESSFFESFNPNIPSPQFSFADYSKHSRKELMEECEFLSQRSPRMALNALKRGIGIHHAGLNFHYRQLVEILFRKGFLRVVIATGTLSLGINMPCKTVIFGGDSIWLTALEYRQSAGRAGRRGFDDLGNVIFLGIPLGKVRRLISSRLPSLIGHFPITTSLILRLFTLLHESDGSEHAKKSINALLSQPRLFMGGDTFKEQVLHHVRFSIEFLRRQRLIGPGGEPTNFSRLTGHLYYTEHSGFAFHALLKSGFFHSLCAEISEKPRKTCMKLMHVLACLFCRRPCHLNMKIPRLPPLPPTSTEILEKHNKMTLEVYTTYVKTFAAEYCNDTADNILPFSHSVCGGTEGPTPIQPLPPTLARSSFVALSGADDKFSSISDLADSVRAGIFLESAAVPYLDTSEMTPLNSYLLDFYRHGEAITLTRENEIRKCDIWFVLRDFGLVLDTIITSLTNFVTCESGDDATDAADEADAADAAGLGDLEDYEVKERFVDMNFEGDDSDDLTDEDYMDTFDMTNLGHSDMEIINVLKAFELLRTTFMEKFVATWS